MGLPSFSHPLSQMSNTGVDNSPIDVLEEMEHQSVLQMTHVDRPASVSWSTFLDHDVVITWSGPSHAPANDDYDSSGSLSGLLEHTPPRSLVSQKTTDGPSIQINLLSHRLVRKTESPRQGHGLPGFPRPLSSLMGLVHLRLLSFSYQYQ